MIHTEILAEIGADADALELYDELMKVATRYAAIRTGVSQSLCKPLN